MKKVSLLLITLFLSIASLAEGTHKVRNYGLTITIERKIIAPICFFCFINNLGQIDTFSGQNDG